MTLIASSEVERGLYSCQALLAGWHAMMFSMLQMPVFLILTCRQRVYIHFQKYKELSFKKGLLVIGFSQTVAFLPATHTAFAPPNIISVPSLPGVHGMLLTICPRTTKICPLFWYG